MATISTTELNPAMSQAAALRRTQLVWPREHGAWGMLLVPLATGAITGALDGGNGWYGLLFTVAALALFCLHTPLESLIGTAAIKAQNAEEKHLASRYALIFAAVALASLAALLAAGRFALLPIGLAAAVMFGTQMFVRRLRGRWTRMTAQVLGAAGLTATAAGAYCAVTGSFDETALALWLANLIFAGNQIHFVQLRLRASRAQDVRARMSRGRAFFTGQFAMLVALAACVALRVMPGLALIAFVPVVVRGVLWFWAAPQPLNLKRLGFTELAHAIAFGILLVVAFG